MKPFFIETTVRWSDLDANRHLANASYMNFSSFARMSFLNHLGIGMIDMMKWNLGPAVLREEFSFFKEGYDNEEVIVTVELSGMSEEGDLFEFQHNFYKKKSGKHMAFSKVIGVWFSMDTRKISPLPTDVLAIFKTAIDKNKLRIMSKEDLKTLPVKPQDIDINSLIN